MSRLVLMLLLLLLGLVRVVLTQHSVRINDELGWLSLIELSVRIRGLIQRDDLHVEQLAQVHALVVVTRSVAHGDGSKDGMGWKE